MPVLESSMLLTEGHRFHASQSFFTTLHFRSCILRSHPISSSFIWCSPRTSFTAIRNTPNQLNGGHHKEMAPPTDKRRATKRHHAHRRGNADARAFSIVAKASQRLLGLDMVNISETHHTSLFSHESFIAKMPRPAVSWSIVCATIDF